MRWNTHTHLCIYIVYACNGYNQSRDPLHVHVLLYFIHRVIILVYYCSNVQYYLSARSRDGVRWIYICIQWKIIFHLFARPCIAGTIKIYCSALQTNTLLYTYQGSMLFKVKKLHFVKSSPWHTKLLCTYLTKFKLT